MRKRQGGDAGCTLAKAETAMLVYGYAGLIYDLNCDKFGVIVSELTRFSSFNKVFTLF